MEGKKLILITNDDGIDAPGLRRLALAAAKAGEVYVVAPDSQRSAMSHSITCKDVLKVKAVDLKIDGVTAYSCSGTPADCVNLGAKKLLPRIPDYVFSGINYGFNISTDIQYSGTAGAAFEGANIGIHSIAFSRGVAGGEETMELYLEKIMEYCMGINPGKNRIWNVNFPECSPEECRGVYYNTKVYIDGFYEDIFDEEDSDGEIHNFRLSSKRNWEAPEGTDLGAVIAGYVSVGIVNNIS